MYNYKVFYHKPTETYEFEYDETDENDDDYYNR